MDLQQLVDAIEKRHGKDANVTTVLLEITEDPQDDTIAHEFQLFFAERILARGRGRQ